MIDTVEHEDREALDLMFRDSFPALAEELGLPPYDLLLVSDGSGTLIQNCGGFCGYEYNPRKHQYLRIVGCANHLTNNSSELLPFLFALYRFDYQRQTENVAYPSPLRVQCVSDSELTVKCGNRQYERKANLCFWRGIESFEQNGYSIGWTHVKRNTNAINVMADDISRKARHLMEGFINGR